MIGEPHLDFGEVSGAFAVLLPQARLFPEPLTDYAAQGLAKVKRLARVVFIDAISRSPSGRAPRGHLKREVFV
jgi:acyl-CoA synthetase (AMP-forming)/AMP-acid ligase II